MRVGKIYCYFILLTFFFSCKKDKDAIPPVITINSPAANSSFNVFDNVAVNALVTDDNKITTASITLVNSSYIPVHNSISVPVSGLSMTINANYWIDNIHLETGIYYLMIMASDGVNDTRKYQTVLVTAVPKVLKQVYVVRQLSNQQTGMDTLDQPFTAIFPFQNFSGDHIGSSVSSYYQWAYISGKQTGDFKGINLEHNTVKFSIAPGPSDYFTGYFSDDKTTYLSNYDGSIKGYDYSGNLIYKSNLPFNLLSFYPQHLCFNNKYLIAEEKDKNSSVKKLVTYYPSGSAMQDCSLSQDVVEMHEKDNNNIFVFGNNFSGHGVIQLFDRSANYLYSPYTGVLSTVSDTVLSIVKIDEITYLIGLSDGIIYRYVYPASFSPYLSGYRAIQLKYDDLNDELYVVEKNKLSKVNYSTQAVSLPVYSTENILDLHLLYNR